MENWSNIISLLFTILLFVAAIGGAIFVANMISTAVANTKESLKTKGLHVTDGGLAIKMDKKMDRENYLDRTQAGIVNAMKHSTFGNKDDRKNLTTENGDLNLNQSELKKSWSGLSQRKSGL